MSNPTTVVVNTTSNPAAVLRAALASGSTLLVGGVHDGLSARIAERCGMSALWASGLGIAASHGMPDANILTLTEVRDAAAIIVRSSTLPVIADCDTGFGEVRNLRRLVQEFELAGVAAICIEDKLYPKRNSFLPGQELIDPCEFAMKLRLAKVTQLDPNFLVIARVESLLAGKPVEEALRRARLYVEAGADAIVIHSKSDQPDEVLDFARVWKAERQQIPLIVIPTTYTGVTLTELESAGIAMVIYANQGLRAAVYAMEATLSAIVESGSSESVEPQLAPLAHLFELTEEDEVDRCDSWFTDALERIRRSGDVATLVMESANGSIRAPRR